MTIIILIFYTISENNTLSENISKSNKHILNQENNSCRLTKDIR